MIQMGGKKAVLSKGEQKNAQTKNCQKENKKRANYLIGQLKINKMDSENRSQEHSYTRREFTHAWNTPYAQSLTARELTPKEEAAKDLWIITNSIMKRKFLRALERIKLFNFDSARKEVANDNIQMGFRLAEEYKGKKKKLRTRSLDPYAEYSRSRLLQDIVGKLRAKNQGNSWQQDNTTVLYEKVKNLEKLVNTQKNNSYSEYEGANTSNSNQQNTSTEELKEAIRKIRRDIDSQRLNQRAPSRDRVIEDTSHITHVQPSINSSVYRDLSEFTHFGNYNSQNRNSVQGSYHQYGYANQRKPQNISSKQDYERVRAYVSPQSVYRFSYQPRQNPPNNKYHNEYQSIPNQNRPQSSYEDLNNFGNSFLNSTQINPHFIDINASNSFENMISPQQKDLLFKTNGESSIQKRDRVKSKQKIKIISELPIKGRNSQKRQQTKGKEVKRTYEIITPSLESNSKKTESHLKGPLRMNSPPPLPPRQKEQAYFCDCCDRCCSCEPQS